MRSGMKTILAVVIAVILCCVAFGGYIVYDNMQKQNQELNKSLQDVQKQLNETQNNSSTNTTTKATSTTKKATPTAKPASNKVTYEEAGVDKNIGYIKTCKYKGCGARYDSRLSYCPSCGQRNIYV